jgi:hypothetical protein
MLPARFARAVSIARARVFVCSFGGRGRHAHGSHAHGSIAVCHAKHARALARWSRKRKVAIASRLRAAGVAAAAVDDGWPAGTPLQIATERRRFADHLRGPAD